MIELFARSEWIAASVIRFPALLDELIDPSLGRQIPASGDLLKSVSRLLSAGQETETVLAGLNYLKLATSLRIAVAQLAGTIDSQQAQSGLSSLAAAVLHGVLELATREVELRHGRMAHSEDFACGSRNTLAIIAYGSLGASEPGYESDLDLVFLFADPQSVSSGNSDGKGTLPAERYYARLAQRVLSLLTVMTPSGRLYPVDTRLRPNGRAGSLVSSLDAFAEYQLRQAWTWELQALTRARFIAGCGSTAERFSSIRREALMRPRREEDVRIELADMRKRMAAELAGGEAAAGPKHQPGGLVDIEWVVQLGVLAKASNSLALVQETSIPGQLSALVEIGWLSAADAGILQVTAQALHQQRMLQTLVPGEERAAVDTRAASRIYARLLGAERD
jgi:glutamate-ammonia-ligase adenylyltransferase